MTCISLREGRHRLSVAHLLTALMVLFVVMPLVDTLPDGNIFETVAFTLVLLAAVNAIGGHRRIQITATFLAVPAMVMHWLPHLWAGLVPAELGLLADTLFVTYVIVHLLRFVISAPEVDAEVMCAAISIFLLLAVAWSFLYTMLDRWDPDSFAFTNTLNATPKLARFLSLYFSVQVITTITFGDILPVSNIARMFTLAEAITGVFYIAILISRLVGVYVRKPPADSQL